MTPDTRFPDPHLIEARLRLAYINQHRELALGSLFALALGARLMGVGVSTPILLLVGIWFALACAFVRHSARALGTERLYRIEFIYFALEISLITALVHFAPAAQWLTVLFYVVTVLYAHLVLPPRRALAITAVAAIAFAALVALQAFGLTRGGWIGASPHPGYLAALLALGALAVYLLIGFTVAQFSRTINAQAQALQAANRDLYAVTEELRLHRQNLEELVEQRTRDLNRASEDLRRANHELRRLNQLKSNFLANVSHELRTPLTSIRSFSEILLNYPEEDVFTRCEFLEIIISESDRLTRLINDVLDLAKIEAGHMDWRPQPVQLADLARQSLDVIRVVAAHKGLQLFNQVASDLPLVPADADRMLQVFTNLLSNALKFTAAGSIQIGSLTRPGEVLIYVADTGCGIDAADLDRIFDKFYQHGNQLTDKPSGSGLGLSICREIMNYHRGRIWVESTPGQGTTVYCALPSTPRSGVEGSASCEAPQLTH